MTTTITITDQTVTVDGKVYSATGTVIVTPPVVQPPVIIPPVIPPAGSSVQFAGCGYPVSSPDYAPQSKTFTTGLYGGNTGVYNFTVPQNAKDGIGKMNFANATVSAANPVNMQVYVNGKIVFAVGPAFAGSAPNLYYSVGTPDPNVQVNLQRGDQVVVWIIPTGDALNDMKCDHLSPGTVL